MSINDEFFDEICSRFSHLYWHDSEIVNLHLLRDLGGRKYSLELDVDLYEKNSVGKIEQMRRTIVFTECRIVQMDFDLLGLLFCNGAIGNAACNKDSVQLEKSKRGKLKSFDFPDAFNPLENCLGFSFEMIHPSGELLIYARNFEIKDSV